MRAESERLVGVLVARTRAPVSPVFRTRLLAGPDQDFGADPGVTARFDVGEGRCAVLALTEDAIEGVQAILTAPGVPEGAGVPITAATPASGPSTAVGLQVALAAVPDEGDEVIEEAGARVFLEDIVAELLQDKLLDADHDGEQVRFSIGNASWNIRLPVQLGWRAGFNERTV